MKVNQALKEKLEFKTKEIEEPQSAKTIIISTEYFGVYKQYSYVKLATVNNDDDVDYLNEIKNTLTWAIETALNKSGFEYPEKRK